MSDPKTTTTLDVAPGIDDDTRPKASSKSSILPKILLVVFSPLLIVLLLIGLLVFGIAYVTCNSRAKRLLRDIKFIRGLSMMKSQVKNIYDTYGENYTAIDIWENVLSKVSRDKVMLVFLSGVNDDPVRKVTYSEMDSMSNRVASWARTVGLEQRDTVALVMNNQPEFIMIWLGLAKIGVTIAFVNPTLKGKPLKHAVSLVESKLAIYATDVEDTMKAVEGIPMFKVIAPGDNTTKLTDSGVVDFTKFEANKVDRSARSAVKFTDTLFHIFTSGTTGLPKAARIHHMKFLSTTIIWKALYSLRNDDSVYCCLPMCHSSATMVGLGSIFSSGLTMVLRRKFSSAKYFEDCATHGATVGMYIGELCRYLNATPKSEFDRKHRLRLMIGNGMRPDVWKDFIERFRVPQIGEFYASTEGNANLINMDNTFGAVGFVSPLLERQYPVKFVKVDQATGEIVRNPKTGLCELAACNEPGELVGLVDNTDPTRRFDGYSQKEATKKKLLRDVTEKGDVYFRTGDLLRKDKYGYVYFVDRIGDTFRWKGENVSTTEVAQVISAVPGILEANVYGVEIPGHDGRAGMAAITFNEGVDAATFPWAKLVKEMQVNLASYAAPVFVRIVTEMDTTGTFKHKKVEMRKQGADPVVVPDQVFYMNHESKTFKELTPDVYDKMKKREIRL